MAPPSELLGSLTLSLREWKDDGRDGGDDDEEEEEQHNLARFEAPIPPLSTAVSSSAVSSSSATAAKTATLSSYLSSMRPLGSKPSEFFKLGGC
jgi:hypothetical protein